MVDEAEHGHIIQGVEVVVGLAVQALGLRELHLAEVAAILGHQSAHVGIGVVDGAQQLHKRAVVESEAREVLHLAGLAHTLQHLIESGTQGVHHGILLALVLHADDHAMTLFPQLQELRYQLGRVLQVGHHQHGSVTRSLTETIEGRAYVAEVHGVHDNLHPTVLCRNAFQHLDGTVGRGVVDKDVLVVVAVA